MGYSRRIAFYWNQPILFPTEGLTVIFRVEHDTHLEFDRASFGYGYAFLNNLKSNRNYSVEIKLGSAVYADEGRWPRLKRYLRFVVGTKETRKLG